MWSTSLIPALGGRKQAALSPLHTMDLWCDFYMGHNHMLAGYVNMERVMLRNWDYRWLSGTDGSVVSWVPKSITQRDLPHHHHLASRRCPFSLWGQLLCKGLLITWEPSIWHPSVSSRSIRREGSRTSFEASTMSNQGGDILYNRSKQMNEPLPVKPEETHRVWAQLLWRGKGWTWAHLRRELNR